MAMVMIQYHDDSDDDQNAEGDHGGMRGREENEAY